MASDLVERLRADRDWHRNPTRWSHEAADEIERLRASTNDAPVERLVEAKGQASQVDWLKVARDYEQAALDGSWPSIPAPHYALSGAFKALGDEIASLRTALSNSPVVGEDACTCQRHPTHCANDCPQHGLSEPTYTAGERVDVPPTPTDTADRREAAIDQLSGIASPSAGVLRVEQAEALTLLIETARVSTNKDETIAKLREALRLIMHEGGDDAGECEPCWSVFKIAQEALTSTKKEG